jgi:hypothetical protein
MNELEIVRLADGKKVWMSCGSSAAAMTDLTFEFQLNRGGFLSLTFEGRRGVVFPYDVFCIESERYYFGPPLQLHQPVRQSKLAWLHGPAPVNTPHMGLLPGAALRIALGTLVHLVTTRQHFAAIKDTSKPFLCRTRFAAWMALVAATVPLTAHAPAPNAKEQAQATAMIQIYSEVQDVVGAADATFQDPATDNVTPSASREQTQGQQKDGRTPDGATQIPTQKSSQACRVSAMERQLLSEQGLLQVMRKCAKHGPKGQRSPL